MRSTLRNVMPSMFHRRLLLLIGAMLVVLAVLGTATTMLATGQSHADAREIANSKLRRQQVIQTKRGAILDRHGHVLAEDDPSWELAVHFDLLTGKWAYRQAYADASRDKLVWGEMSQDQREQIVTKLQREYEQQTEAVFTTLAELSGIGAAEMQERRRDTVARINRLQSFLWRRWQQQESQERGEPVPLKDVAKPIKAETEHHVLIPDLDDRLRLQIEKFIDEGRRAMQVGDERSRSALPWTRVELRRTTVRRYPMDRMVVELDKSTLPSPIAKDQVVEVEVGGVGLHLIGLMRDAWAEDVAQRPLINRKGTYLLSGYADGDRLGRSGIEQAMERQLCGSRGLRTVNLDTGETIHSVPPSAGRDVTLALDIRLQAHIQAVMSPQFGLMQTLPWHLKPDDPQTLLGTQLNGSAVVIDIASGDVLAAVTMPDAPRELLKEDPDLLWNDPINKPMVNRAVAVPYLPGSTVKPLVLAAAVSDGVLRDGETIHCKGYLWEHNKLVFRDWAWKNFTVERGDITGPEAIMYSNNPFFGHLAEKLASKYERDRLPSWYRAFGFDRKPGTGLDEEISGDVGPRNRELDHNEMCFMSIGQGPLSITPMQSAVAYARLASGDLTRQARLIVSPQTNQQTPPRSDRRLTETARRMAIEGMRRASNDTEGQTRHINQPSLGMNREPVFNVEGVTVLAKSGTADPGSYRWIDLNLNGEQEEGEVERNPRDHAWVVALVQPDGAPNPTHVVACVVEYSGSGTRVSGPVVNQIIHALKQHQYLDWPPTR